MKPTHHRKIIRLQTWDYRTPGPYYITICTKNRKCLFGNVSQSQMFLSPYGQIVVKAWRKIAKHRQSISLDQFICMPNHVHGILWLENEYFDSSDTSFQQPNVLPGSLGAVVRSFKSAVTRSINLSRTGPKPAVWQGRYHDRIIRNRRELNAAREYIRDNPLNWPHDADYDPSKW